MLPIKHALESASTEAQVLRCLSSFLDHLRSCKIDSLLPHRFSGLSACNDDEIRAWSGKLAESRNDTYPLGAAERCWLEEVRDAFAAAARRLDEIAQAKQQSAPGVIRDTAIASWNPRVQG
jgi:hypothetical protein